MKINEDLKRLAELLEGLNYTVFLRVYKSTCNEPAQAGEPDPTGAIMKVFPDGKIANISTATVKQARQQFERDIQYRGDQGHGPDAEKIDSEEFKALFEKVRDDFLETCNAADSIHEFVLNEGHPAYPVFWDFAFLFQTSDQSIIWICSSSD